MFFLLFNCQTSGGLKAAYASQIQIHIGLETEYFPAFDRAGYYRKEFWTLAKETGVPLIFGLDAHWLKELVPRDTVDLISES